MIEMSWVLVGVFAPVAVGILAMIVWCQPWRTPSQTSSSLGWSFALVDAFLGGSLGYVLLTSPLPWPPREAAHWLLLAVTPAILATEMLARWNRFPGKGVHALRLCLAVAAPLVVLQTVIKNSSSTSAEIIPWLVPCVLLSTILVAVWVGFGRLLRVESQSHASMLCIGAAAGTAGFVMILSGSQTIGQTGVTLGMAIVGVLLGSLLIRNTPEPGGAIGIALVILTALLVQGCVLANLKLWHAALLLLAPMTAWISQWHPIWKLRAWQSNAIACAATFVVASPVVIDAILTFTRRSAETSMYGG